EPFKPFLSTIHFDYAGETQSVAKVGYFKFVEFFIRKGAHVTIFFLLGLGLTQGTFMYQKNRWLHWPLVTLSCTGIAAFDEFHQMLTGGRTPLFQDVMLDTA
ncbi:MAG TPA: VanZ family protein, partial [Lactobacillus sp.]|nr:VanZ family protein [Lactobacillus sp.]